MYVAVKGGEKAIDAAHALQAHKRRGDTNEPELAVGQIAKQLSGAVDRVMCEGGVYDKTLAALAIKQASGDLVEAIFLLRAYRTTLPRLASLEPIDTNSVEIERRISAVFKDIPGGQVLGPTYDYSHRLLDFSLLSPSEQTELKEVLSDDKPEFASVCQILEKLGLLVLEEDDQTPPGDITSEPPTFPASRSERLQQLARGDEGYLLALGYSTQRGYGRNHPFAGEIRQGQVTVSVVPEELGFAIEIGSIEVTECQMITGFTGDKKSKPKFTRGYGLAFGFSERKAMAMSLLDRALMTRVYNEPVSSPAQDEEFVLAHSDNVEAAGFVSHLKLPHYVDFQSELALIRQLQAEFQEACHD
ncbi:carbon-phosphorus lyase complex subunit PhnI [Salinibius halmophilus]|uniref:carbon-phosphorus lyase complex subunit PhnI n=1 Tax=Salinibius halmophilus TaxID=1853216 RepID=UPI000E66E1EE|nr:carbon-phosphorus lyase complex subunit PhnI [Salinibius halmophilus]